ncbi:MAG: hypothetical protein FD163_2523 [Hyphomonadaceae bacterium]|nr:MAG: hypothetical protein FD128_744 [Hyphomonadaceae bacterium]KAF0182733.1 MAG: hypothetical protein FD163_2523 [Hyphomonadaceae bacterium]
MKKFYKKLGATFVFGAVLPSAALAEPGRAIVGAATVVDGDSLRINNEPIRLWGIDAFEANQMCGAMDCGQIATSRLTRLVQVQNNPGTPNVICIEKSKDNYGRTVAVCRIGGVDLAATLTIQGFALAYREYSLDYVPEEDFARINRTGAWAFEFANPWDFRRGRTESSDTAGAPTQPVETPINPPATAAPVYSSNRQSAPAGCSIKGNINSRGDRIYHTTSSPNYSRTVPERMFCTEAEARAAGFRAPRR